MKTLPSLLRRFPVIRDWWEAFGRIEAQRDQALAERDVAIAERDAALSRHEAGLPASRELPTAAEIRRDQPGSVPPPRPDIHGDASVGDRSPPAVPARTNSGRHAVIVPVHGAVDGREIGVTQPFFADYCRAIGADLRIVDVPGSVPDLRVKASLLPVAREYRRFAIIDADVLIRKACPDLFALAPEAALSAVIEGDWADRSAPCAEISEMYGFAAPLPTARYIDTGVMVMSERHLPLLETLSQVPVLPHPRGEQGLINAGLYRDEVRVHGLRREFNWTPYRPEEFDWRWAWIFHMGDYWRAPPRQQTAALRRRDDGGPREMPVPLEPRHCRLPCLIELAGQLHGETIRVVHPGEMGYHPPAGRLLITDDNSPVMWCEAWPRPGFAGLPGSSPIYGPYASLEAGRWSVSLLAADLSLAADRDIVADVVYDSGDVAVREPAPIGPDATFDIVFDQDVRDVEVRIYRGDRDFSVGAIVFRRLD